jgi:hypothetical protein
MDRNELYQIIGAKCTLYAPWRNAPVSVGVFYCHLMISAILVNCMYSQRLSKNPKSVNLVLVSY